MSKSGRFSKQEIENVEAYIGSIRSYISKEAESEESPNASEDSFSWWARGGRDP